MTSYVLLKSLIMHPKAVSAIPATEYVKVAARNHKTTPATLGAYISLEMARVVLR